VLLWPHPSAPFAPNPPRATHTHTHTPTPLPYGFDEGVTVYATVNIKDAPGCTDLAEGVKGVIVGVTEPYVNTKALVAFEGAQEGAPPVAVITGYHVLVRKIPGGFKEGQAITIVATKKPGVVVGPSEKPYVRALRAVSCLEFIRVLS